VRIKEQDMQIIVQDKVGGPEVMRLVTRADPVAGPGEMLVQVAAAGVNPVDAAVRAGDFPLLGAAPFTVGWDVAGRVLAVGAGVADFAPGDRVFGMPRFPAQAAAYASHVAAPADEMARIPDGMTDAEAGALPLAGLTAWQGLVTHGQIKAGQRVLIHAGAGGVGHLAVQIAVALGADVTATASAGKTGIVRGLGAARVLDYAKEPVGAGYDLVLDAQAGAQAERSVAATKDAGRVVCLLPPSEAALAQAAARGIACIRMIVAPDAAGLQALADLSARGALRVIVARRFALRDAGAAQDYLDTRPVGKVVLEP
jgi:NADPH:quinone reductase-like Zn-dependent oxidoreductase